MAVRANIVIAAVAVVTATPTPALGPSMVGPPCGLFTQFFGQLLLRLLSVELLVPWRRMVLLPVRRTHLAVPCCTLLFTSCLGRCRFLSGLSQRRPEGFRLLLMLRHAPLPRLALVLARLLALGDERACITQQLVPLLCANSRRRQMRACVHARTPFYRREFLACLLGRH